MRKQHCTQNAHTLQGVVLSSQRSLTPSTSLLQARPDLDALFAHVPRLNAFAVRPQLARERRGMSDTENTAFVGGAESKGSDSLCECAVSCGDGDNATNGNGNGP